MIAELVNASLGKQKSDLVILNGTLLNVVTEEIYEAGVAFYGSKIVAVGKVDQCIGEKTRVIDARGKYIIPGLIDGHMHIEVTKITVSQFAEAVLPRGTTSVMTILDQTAAVAGVEGVRATLDEARETPLKLFNIPPLKLPITFPESTARKFGYKEAEEAICWPENCGFCLENEDFLTELDPEVLKVMDLAFSKGLLVHGSCPRLTGPGLASHASAGVRSDHEMICTEETLERMRNGVYVLIREAPMAHNLSACLKALTDTSINIRRACLCGDDWESRDIVQLGHMDHIVRLAIQEGMDPVRAIQMATLNTAEAYRVDHIVGSVTPGKAGDVLVLNNTRDFKVEKVFANGKLIAADGKMCKKVRRPRISNLFFHTFNMQAPVTPEDIVIKTDDNARRVKIITIDQSKQTVVKQKGKATLKAENGRVLPDLTKDIIYVTSAERHFGTGSKSTAFISGYGLKSGAFATSYHPEDSNILAIGTDAADIAYAINYISDVKGAQIVVDKQKVVEVVHLPIGGIRANISAKEMAAKEIALERALKKRGCTTDRPFAMMLFLSLTSMPDLAITDKGLVDWETRSYISPIAEVLK